MHYQYQPKHTKETDVARVPLASRSLKSGVAAAAVTAALLPALLATPALAATQIGIDGSTYTEAASGTGSNGGSWSWGGNDSDPLNLNGSNGGAISWQGGDLTINATGDNTVGAGTDSGQGLPGQSCAARTRFWDAVRTARAKKPAAGRINSR